MTTTIGRSSRGRGKRGFTLIEVLIAITIGALVLGVATGSFNFLSKAAYSAGNYQMMGLSGRIALETFGNDARMAKEVTSIAADNKSAAFAVLNDDGSTTAVRYVFDEDAGTLARIEGSDSDVLLTGVNTASLSFYDLNGELTTTPLQTKEAQLHVKIVRQTISLDNTDEIISARFMMRNRKTSSL